MSFQTAKKIIDEQMKRNYKGRWIISENGEPFLNNEWYKIAQYLRSGFPQNDLCIFSNMEVVNEDLGKKILGLAPSLLVFNMDGASKRPYEFIKKGLNFDKVKRNILGFIELRNNMKSNCRVQVNIMSVHRYLKTIGEDASKFEDDTEEVINLIKPYLRGGDEILADWTIGMWHLRERLNIKKIDRCSLILRIVNEIYVAPNAIAYPCCVMYNADIALGNIEHQSINEIWRGRKRKEFLRNLFKKDYSEIGPPCSICV